MAQCLSFPQTTIPLCLLKGYYTRGDPRRSLSSLPSKVHTLDCAQVNTAKMLNIDLPNYTRIVIEQDSHTSTTIFSKFPTSVLTQYSSLARKQLPISHTSLHQGQRVALMPFQCTIADAISLRLILQFLRWVAQAKHYGSPQIRVPGLFIFMESLRLYRTILQLRLPWEQHLLLTQLLHHITETPLSAEELRFIWENFPKDHVLTRMMLRCYVCFVKAKLYGPMELKKIKTYFRNRPELLTSLDRTVVQLRFKAGDDAVMRGGVKLSGGIEQTSIVQQQQLIARGARPMTLEFVRVHAKKNFVCG